jgi:hypothetical protein
MVFGRGFLGSSITQKYGIQTNIHLKNFYGVSGTKMLEGPKIGKFWGEFAFFT